MESPPECWKGINTQQSRGGGWDRQERDKWDGNWGEVLGGAWEGFEPGLGWGLGSWGRPWDAVGLWRWDWDGTGIFSITKSIWEELAGVCSQKVWECVVGGWGFPRRWQQCLAWGLQNSRLLAQPLAMALLSWEVTPGRGWEGIRALGCSCLSWPIPTQTQPACGVSLCLPWQLLGEQGLFRWDFGKEFLPVRVGRL